MKAGISRTIKNKFNNKQIIKKINYKKNKMKKIYVSCIKNLYKLCASSIYKEFVQNVRFLDNIKGISLKAFNKFKHKTINFTNKF
jgi:hypothetical protein